MSSRNLAPSCGEAMHFGPSGKRVLDRLCEEYMITVQ
uniref:Uncharacterized protein n=1 Tax=Arundo donax TaxID=35708 RepID=A0A0A9GL12_ARUDO